MAETDSGFKWLDGYIGKEYVLRPSINSNPFVYLPITKDLATLEMRGKFFPLMGPERVVVKKVELDLENGEVVFKIRNDHGEEGKFRFIAPKVSEETMGQRHLDGLLNLVVEDAGVPAYVLNESSGRLHFKGSNHTHMFVPGREYDQHQDALAEGMALCPACFSPIHLLPDYDKEMAMGRRIAVEVRNSYPAVMNDSLQTYIQVLGENVLDDWPVPLRGYQYRFTVVDGPSPNAVACPGGWIFVYRGLLEICESEQELEAVLAHEISHVEMRHGLRQLRSAEKAARIGALAGAILIGVGGANSDTATMVAGGIAILMANTAIEIALAGYSRDMEMESDAIAVNYLIHSRGSAERHNLAQVLAKMEYMRECGTGHHRQTSSFSSHPSNNVRSDFAENANVMFFDPPLSFDIAAEGGSQLMIQVFGISHHPYYLHNRQITYDDKYAHEFGFEEGGSGRPGKGWYLSDTRVFLAVKSSSRVPRGLEFKEMKLFLDGKWVYFDNKEDTELYPNTTISMAFSRRQSGKVRFTSLVPTKVQFSGKSAGSRQPPSLGLD